MQPRIKLKRNPTSNNKDHIKNYICSNLRAKVLPSLLATKGNNAPKENWKTKGNKQQKRTRNFATIRVFVSVSGLNVTCVLQKR